MTRPVRVALWVVAGLVAVVVGLLLLRLFGVLGVLGGAGAIASAAVVTRARRTVRQERTAAGRRHAEESAEVVRLQDRLDATEPRREPGPSGESGPTAEEVAARLRARRGRRSGGGSPEGAA